MYSAFTNNALMKNINMFAAQYVLYCLCVWGLKGSCRAALFLLKFKKQLPL